jgi:cellulose synthase/poly-beta-1,6-N-acetylglucosamine synthase-like glycosyltransferase
MENSITMSYEPNVTILIAAFNEADCIREKAINSLELDYPSDKYDILFITDGSTDGTEKILREFMYDPRIRVFHNGDRRGKLAAVERGMNYVPSPIVILTDANTILNKAAIRNIVRHYEDPMVGAVAGEKRIRKDLQNEGSGAGEGLYWKYESALKRMDSELYSVVGAAGELFSCRKELYRSVPPDSIIEDFHLSMCIAAEGYRVIYEPDAFAEEQPSASFREEMKRKIRICAGGFQSIMRLRPLLNMNRYGVLSFQYISHRVLRWAVTPFLLPVLFVINGILALYGNSVYQYLFAGQIMFYTSALIGYVLDRVHLRSKIFIAPLYFTLMNIAAYAGLVRYLKGTQSAVWEKAQRKK